jgi:hypothetical protein
VNHLNSQYRDFQFLLEQNQNTLKKATDNGDVNAMKQPLQSYTHFLNAFYDGKETGAGRFALDDEIRLTTKELIGALEIFQNEIANRIAKGTTEESNEWVDVASKDIASLSIRLRENIRILMEDSNHVVDAVSGSSVV